LRNKAARGFDRCIMVLGYDHHGYVQRLDGLRQAMGLTFQFDAILYQLVKIKSAGKQVRMSKRAGTIVSLDEVIETVGRDVARFFYLNRKADAQLEFDLDLACTTTQENPVYYIQYAYVRIKSIFAKADNPVFDNLQLSDLGYLSGDDDKLMLKKIIALKMLLLQISQNYQTHLLSYYTLELAQSFHRYYGKYHIADIINPTQSRGRLLLLRLIQQNFELCMHLLGISCPEKM
jgi:arginyl-tRNA synthetase